MEKTMYQPIIRKLEYWRDYTGTGDRYRQEHDFDCIMTGGNLHADVIISLWLPLRHSLNFYDYKGWNAWKDYEYEQLKPERLGLKDCPEFLNDLIQNIERFLPPDGPLTSLLIALFTHGQKRANVMLLPYRDWNTRRGRAPFYDYLPHYLYSLLVSDHPLFLQAVKAWIRQENLQMFFEQERIDKDHIRDLAGTGAPWLHSPGMTNLPLLLQNYNEILQERERLLSNTVYDAQTA